MVFSKGFKTFIASIATVGGITANQPAAVAGGSLELNTSLQRTLIDTKIWGNLPADFSFFGRSKTTIKYDNTVASFSFVDLKHQIALGINAVGEVQFTKNGVIPRLGANYSTELFKDFGLFAHATASLKEKTDLDVVLNLSYTPKLTDELKLLTNLEVFNNFNEQGVSASQTAHAGVTWGVYSLGLSATLTEFTGQPMASDFSIFGRANF